MCEYFGKRNEKLKSVHAHGCNHSLIDTRHEPNDSEPPHESSDWSTFNSPIEYERTRSERAQMNSPLHNTESASILNGLAGMVMNLYRSQPNLAKWKFGIFDAPLCVCEYGICYMDG